MTSIKVTVAQEIVDSIIADMQQETNNINNRLVDMLESSVDDYRQERYHTMRKQLDVIKDRFEKNKVRMESELRFEMNKTLREKRSILFDSFKKKLYQSLLDFLKTENYHDYLNTILNENYRDGDVVILRQEDFDKIQGLYTMMPGNLELGGLKIERNHTLYDFSLKSRYEDALQTFIAESKITLTEASL